MRIAEPSEGAIQTVPSLCFAKIRYIRKTLSGIPSILYGFLILCVLYMLKG